MSKFIRRCGGELCEAETTDPRYKDKLWQELTVTFTSRPGGS